MPGLHRVPGPSSPGAWPRAGCWEALKGQQQELTASLSKAGICRRAEREGPGGEQSDRNEWGLEGGLNLGGISWAQEEGCRHFFQSSCSLEHYSGLWSARWGYLILSIHQHPHICFKIPTETSIPFMPPEMNFQGCLIIKSALLQCFSNFN